MDRRGSAGVLVRLFLPCGGSGAPLLPRADGAKIARNVEKRSARHGRMGSAERKELKCVKEQVLAVQRMQDYIEKNRTEDITLSELAGASLFSPWYSYRLFREYIGLTPTEYIRKYRLTQAARRLRTGKVKVIDAAYDAGFSNADTFTRAFYREFGLNPGDYMNLSVKSGTVFGLLGAVGAVAICAGGLMGLPQAVSTMREYKILKRLHVTPVSPVFILGVELTMYIVYCSVSLAVLVVPAALFCMSACAARCCVSSAAGRLQCSRRSRSACWSAAWQGTRSRRA
ncbi:MAG: hypothetical protein DBY22_08850 [Clostridiales bacterium]|nr:MAG: hypothetical protein DBY22_08850 [Clostridiales bacterium]